MDQYIADMRNLATYRDSAICVTDTTGGGNRFHGYRVLKFHELGSILKAHQKNASFVFTSRARIQVNTHNMTDHNTCRGVIDPDSITAPPHSLKEVRKPKCCGAVTKHVYVAPNPIKDTLLHGLCSHATVLDVWVVNQQIWVFRMKDRHIRNGLIQHMTTIGKPQACKARLRLRRSGTSGPRAKGRRRTGAASLRSSQ